jgi:DNA-binding transcriptional ArsR family regulator
MSKVTPDQNSEFINTSANLLNALSNASRLNILTILSEREMSVLPLSELVGLSQSALSQHLAKLRDAKLVAFRRDAQTVYYRCDSPDVAKILATLSSFFDVAEPKNSEAA